MLTAAENIKLPLSVAGEKVDPVWFADLTAKVGLTERLDHRPAELSGGQQQRVAVARSLIARPTVVFADEPTGNLDTKSSAEILALLRDMSVSYGQTIVMVTHDPRAAAIADRILYILDGRVVLDRAGESEAEILKTMNELDSLAPA
jgi:putative ABC transport system ATP-binding protein